MLGGVTRHMLPHLSGVLHLHINRPQNKLISLKKLLYLLFIYSSSRQKKRNHWHQNLPLHNKNGQHLIVPKEKNTANIQIYKLAFLVPRLQIFCLEMTASRIGDVMRAELGYVTETKFSVSAWGSLTETWQHNGHAAVSEMQLLPLWSTDIIKHINASEMPPRGIL